MRTSFLTSILATVVIASALGSNADDSLNKGMVRRHHSKMAARDAEETTHSLQKRSFQGKATYYYIGPGARGACGNVLNNNDYTVALNEVQYGNLGVRSSYCGQTITITNGVKTTQARIEDACPTGVNCHYGALDLSTSLFEFFNDKSVGIFDITWWVGGGSGGGSSSSSSKNSDKASSSSDSSSSSSSSSDAAKASAKAERVAAKEKAAADKAAKEEAAAKKKAAREKAKKEKAAAEKKAKQEAKILAAQKSSLNQFSEIMQTLNQIVADSLDSSSSAPAAAASSTASA